MLQCAKLRHSSQLGSIPKQNSYKPSHRFRQGSASTDCRTDCPAWVAQSIFGLALNSHRCKFLCCMIVFAPNHRWGFKQMRTRAVWKSFPFARCIARLDAAQLLGCLPMTWRLNVQGFCLHWQCSWWRVGPGPFVLWQFSFVPMRVMSSCRRCRMMWKSFLFDRLSW